MPYTFGMLKKIKDPYGIAINIGNKSTAPTLSKNFYHVITTGNNEALENNISVCNQPLAATSRPIVFGHQSPPSVAITFKQLIHDYVFTNEQLKSKKISFITCDIEGGEEDILEDLLHFAYHNKVKVYISFHIDWWKSKKIEDFEYLFKFFRTNCPQANVAEYLKHNPFASILFKPRTHTGTLIKKNTPAVIIGYNQYTYIKNMVEQLEKYTSDIIVVDNNSTFPPLLDYYKNDFKYTLLKQKTNYGHGVWALDCVQKLVGDTYILTDPDLQFNEHLPDNFIQQLLGIANHFSARQVGFALCIDAPDIRTDLLCQGLTVKQWESNFWKKPLACPLYPSLKLYEADIDTTFCLINKKFSGKPTIRVAGDFTCLHLPWHKDFQKKLAPGEYEAYLHKNISSTWLKKVIAVHRLKENVLRKEILAHYHKWH